MTSRIAFLWPEISLFAATCIVMVLGLSPKIAVRRSCAWVCGLALVIAGVLAATTTPEGAEIGHSGQTLLPGIVLYVKCLAAIVGILLLMLLSGSVDREEESRIAKGSRPFDPLRSNRAEFYSFFLFSITGLMLCASADDLIWLFLALELTSLPTYIMVTIAAGSGARGQSQEAGVKYFFLGALGAALFLYGFALIYGGTGTTNLNRIHEVFMTRGINPIALAGVLLALFGLCFKLGAVPMHFYIADVYQGAPAPVSAFLAFVPKAAGVVGVLLLCAAMGWVWSPSSAGGLGEHGPYSGGSLPEPVRLLLWVIAALSMTVGNILAILQTSVKRLLAYSSIAHSGYMLVGIIAGPGPDPQAASFTSSGVSAVLFYLLAYGVMNPGTFAVLASLERRGRDGQPQEIDSFEDLKGMCATRPLLGWTMVLCSLSLLGFPPLLGFLGKLPLFTSGIYAGEIPLVIVLGVNSAIAAFYYLRLFGAVLLEKPDGAPADVVQTPFVSRPIAALVSAGGVVVLMFAAGGLMDASKRAGQTTGARTLMGRGHPAKAPASPDRREPLSAASSDHNGAPASLPGAAPR